MCWFLVVHGKNIMTNLNTLHNQNLFANLEKCDFTGKHIWYFVIIFDEIKLHVYPEKV